MCSAPQWGTSHRKAPVKNLVATVQDGLSDLFSLPDGYEIVLGNGGSTAFWSLACTSLIKSAGSFAVFGEFSSKFAKDAEGSPWLRATDYTAPAGQVAILEADDSDIGAYPQNETSTGAASPLYRAPQELTIVDATSIAGASVVDLELVDVYYFAPQKCFGSDGGLWIAIMSPAAIERAFSLAQKDDRPHFGFLDLKAAILASRKNQTVNTPAIGTLLLMASQIQWMQDLGGLPATSAKSAAGARLIQEWAENRDFAKCFVENPKWRSPVVTTVDIDDDIPVSELANTLRQVGIVDIEGYRGLGRNQLRIASFPSIDTEDIAALLGCLDWVIGK
jgi:Phosphoserine aminotransferase